MNLPNKITIFRLLIALPFIALMLFFGYQNNWTLAEATLMQHLWVFYLLLVIFCLAMASDFLDGYLARKNKNITTFGKIADPIADKIITTSSLIFLTVLNIVPIWITIIFILRDIIIDGVRNLYASKGITIAASIFGKMKTILQSLGIIIIWIAASLFMNNFWEIYSMESYFAISNIVLYLALLLSLYSAYDYLRPLHKYLTFK